MAKSTARKASTGKTAGKSVSEPSAKKAAGKATARKAGAGAAKAAPAKLAGKAAAKKVVARAPAAKAKAAPAKTAPAKTAPAKLAKKAAAKKVVAKAPAAKKASAKKTATKKVAAKKPAAAAKKTSAKPAAAAKKTAAKGTAAASGSKPPANVSTRRTAAKKASGGKARKPVTTIPRSALLERDSDDATVELPESSSATVVPYERDRSSHYMDAAQLTHFSKKLADWKQQLMEEVDRTVGHMKDDATNFPDPNDRATQEEEFSLELRTRDRERKLIKKINEAQKRIDDDEYGYCETCGIEIGISRLEARPTAELCIDCKTLEEIRERQIA